MGSTSKKASFQVYAAIAGVIVLLIINAFAAVHFTDPFGDNAAIDMNHLADYAPDKGNSASEDSSGQETAVTPSNGKLIYPKYPYFIEVDKTNQIVTVFTTSSEGRYDKPVRVMLCSTLKDDKRLPNGYWKLKADRSTSKNTWKTITSYGLEYCVQYVTRSTGPFFFHSVPYTDTKKDALNSKQFAKLGSPVSGLSICLTVENAKWISENCMEGTTVHTTANKKNSALTNALKEQLPKTSGIDWDPTDPDPDNPNYHPQYTEELPETEGYLTDNTGLDKIRYSN